MIVTRKKVDARVEIQILTGMIVSDKFLRSIVPLIKLDYFKTSYARTIARWCMEYNEVYSEAPKKHIQDIYEGHRRSGSPIEDSDIIGEVLARLSKQYEDTEDDIFNADYVLDQAEKYFKERSLKLLMEEIEANLANGRLLEAHEAVATFHVVDRIAIVGCEPFSDKELITQALSIQDEELFSLPGELGDVLGPFKREYLIAVAAPMKRGKTNSMIDLSLQAYYNKLNVVFFSLEMSRHQMVERILRAVTALPKKPGDYMFPVWDCKKSQLGMCKKIENPIIAKSDVGKKHAYERRDFPVQGYKPCENFCEDLDLITWMELRRKPALTAAGAVQHLEGMGQFLHGRYKLVTWPAYSAGLPEITSCLRTWEHLDGFIPDVIVVDYADILKPSSNYNDERHNLDRIWKGLKALSQSTKTLVATGTQTTRNTLDKDNMGQGDIAEDIRKLAHVDLMYGINQTPDEKRWGTARVGVLGQRHDEFDVISQCYILQQPKCGQFCLDSKLKR